MLTKKPLVLSLSAALASLLGLPSTDTSAVAAPQPTEDARINPAEAIITQQGPEPIAYYAVGGDLLSFIITQAADGTIVAQHRSHQSHQSHQSHRSHYSSR